MNFYEKHIGDYTADTVGLTMLEDGAYNRLLDVYYKTERALPGDKTLIYRLARATSSAEKKAVTFVLEHHFILTEGGYSHKRVEEEIAKFNAKKPQADAKRESEKERQRRARERRKELFQELSRHGVNMPWNATTEQLQAEIVLVTSHASHTPVTRDESHPVTRDNTANQSPVPTTHKNNNSSAAATLAGAPAHEPAAPPPSPPGGIDPADRPQQIAVWLRKREIDRGKQPTGTMSSDPRIRAWADHAVTDAQLGEAYALAVADRDGAQDAGPIGPGFLDIFIAKILNPPAAKSAVSRSRNVPVPAAGHWAATWSGIVAKGAELGLAQDDSEPPPAFKARVFAAANLTDEEKSRLRADHGVRI